MKNIILIALLYTISLGNVVAQEENNPMSLGFQLNEYQSDFGLGMQFTSPRFFHRSIALRVRANFMYNEHIDLEKGEYVWSPYQNYTLGIVSGANFITERIACYAEGGVIGITPSDEFSTSDFEFGGYGLFGFEFYFDPGFNYFIELGGIGTGAVKDKIIGKPIYSNGFLLSVGWRIVM